MKRKIITISASLLLALCMTMPQLVNSASTHDKKTVPPILSLLLTNPAQKLSDIVAPLSFTWKTYSDSNVNITLIPNPGKRLVRIYQGSDDGKAETAKLLHEQKTGDNGTLNVKLAIQPHWKELTIVAEDFSPNPPSTKHTLDGSSTINVKVTL